MGLPTGVPTWHFFRGVTSYISLSGALLVSQITVSGFTSTLCRILTFIVDLVPLLPPVSSLTPFYFISVSGVQPFSFLSPLT